MTPPNLTRRPPFYRRLGTLLVLGLFLLAGSSPAIGQERELLIGIEPEHNIFTQMEQYQKLADYLSGKAGIPIRLTIMSRYGEFLQRFKAKHLDGAFLDSYTALLAIDTLGMEPVASQVDLTGKVGARSLIFTRHDSGIHRFAEMRGKSFAFVDPATTEGYLFPLTLLKRHGVGDINTFLSRHFFTGSHASAISAVLDGRADLGAAKDRIYDLQVAKDTSLARELVILDQSPPTPDTTLCLARETPPGLKKKLTDILLEMNENPEGREVLKKIDSRRFTRAAKDDFNIVRQMAKEAGLTGIGH